MTYKKSKIRYYTGHSHPDVPDGVDSIMVYPLQVGRDCHGWYAIFNWCGDTWSGDPEHPNPYDPDDPNPAPFDEQGPFRIYGPGFLDGIARYLERAAGYELVQENGWT